MSFQTRKEWNWIMTGIIITGYGKFAEGLKDALEAVTGPAENIETVSFLKTIRKNYSIPACRMQ